MIAMTYLKRVLQTFAALHIVGGIALPFLGQLNVVQAYIAQKMFPGYALTPDLQVHAAYVVTLFGPTVASWGILFLVLVNSYFSTPTKQKWLGLMAAVLLWFIGDTGYSMFNGVYSVVPLNTLAALAFLVPLWLCRNLHRSEDSVSSQI